MKKKIVIIVVVFALVAGAITGGVFGYQKYQSSKLVADVTNVSNLNWGYGGDSMESYGTVTNDMSQDIQLSTTQSVQEVFVEEGQTVAIGDPLLQYDMTTIDLSIEMKKLDIQTIVNNTNVANVELDKLKKTTPIPTTPVVTTPPAVPQAPAEPVVEEKTGEAYNYISATAVAYQGDGSSANPFHFLCTQDAYVYGEYMNYLKSNSFTAVFDIRNGNVVTGDLVTSRMVNGAMIAAEYETGSKWYVADGSEVKEEVTIPEDNTQEEVVPQDGYTAEELAKAIADKEKELVGLDLQKRTAELALTKLENQSADGMVYATINGVVKTVGDPNNLPNDGSPFLSVTGSDGLFVKGSISELTLDKVKPGQVVTATSWNTGMSFNATITEINDYPDDSNNYGGSGNQNVSYYGYTAYIEDSTGLSNGEGVGLTINVDADASAMSSIYIEKAYVRQEDGKSYVYKADENDRLVKQYVETGKTVYGQAIEIKGGITDADYIAFPYGKTAKEGVKVNKGSDTVTY